MRKGRGRLRLDFGVTLSNTMLDGVVKSSSDASFDTSMNWEDGSENNEINRAIKFTRTLSSGSEIVDLSQGFSFDIGAGIGNDPLGLPFDLVEIVAVVIHNSPESVGDLDLDADWIQSHQSANALKPGAFLLKTTGDSSDGRGGDGGISLGVAANGGSVTYSVVVLGRSDADESSSRSG